MKSIFAISLALTLALSAGAQELKPQIPTAITEAPAYVVLSAAPELIKGVVSRSGGIFRRVYTYETESGRKFFYKSKLSGVADLRAYEDQHPIWNKIQIGSKRWNPVAGSSLSIYALYKLIQGRTW